MTTILHKGGRVIAPSADLGGIFGVLVHDDLLTAILPVARAV